MAAGDRPAGPVLRRVGLSDFRNYATLRLPLDGRTVVLTGPNGAGKTNLLEAMSYLGPGRGLRGARLGDIARREPGEMHDRPARPWAVSGEVVSPFGPVKLSSGWMPAEDGQGRERRVTKVDGEVVSGPAALAEHVSMVWLVPSMDRLFTGPSGDRRRFLDRLVYAIDQGHAARVQRYDHGRRERMRLLGAGTTDGSWLGALERGMAEQAVAIAAARLEFAERLAPILSRGMTPFPQARMAVDGLVERWLAAGPALDAEERYREHLAGARTRDAEAGTSDGPHRGDLTVWLETKQAPAAQCSTGEQKALLIAIVLAHAQLLAGYRGFAPVLLLDEIAAHLDDARREALFDMILTLDAQAWFSGTEARTFAALRPHAQFFAVRAGSVVEED